MGNISREVFEQQRRPQFGTANPERMQMAFWEWAIRGQEPQDTSEQEQPGRFVMGMRNGVLKSGYGPWRVRDRFEVVLNRDDGPIWTFDRMGRTETVLPDGRLVCVGGEHEDFYDPDFCIYNDVVVFEPNGEFCIYGYPEAVFPPTDFHTATLVGNDIILIGGLRYLKDRFPGTCTVFRLDTTTFRMERLEVEGEGPGWIDHHRAEWLDGVIRVRGGSITIDSEAKKHRRKNLSTFELNLTARRWDRVEDLVAGRTFTISRKNVLDLAFSRGNEDGFDPACLTGFDTISAMKHARDSTRRVVVDGVVANLRRELNCCRVRIEGVLQQARLTAFLFELHRQIEREVGVPCEVEER